MGALATIASAIQFCNFIVDKNCPRLGGAFSTVVVGEWFRIKKGDKTMNSMLNELALMALLLVVVVLSGRI